MTDTTSRAFFEQKYRASEDPWNFGSSSYELSRYDAIIKAIGDKRYKHAFEPGCSVGVLTKQLAGRCDRVDAIDISPTAVDKAIRHCSEYANAYITCDSLVHRNDRVAYDLLIFSEIGYYFEEHTLRAVLRRLISQLTPSALLVGCHWLGTSPDHILSGRKVHEIIAESSELIHLHAEIHPGFRLDSWSRR